MSESFASEMEGEEEEEEDEDVFIRRVVVEFQACSNSSTGDMR